VVKKLKVNLSLLNKPLFYPPKHGVYLPHSLPVLKSTASCKRHLVEYCDSHSTFLHKN